MGRLDGKVAVITGSTRGIGLGIAEAYALEGAKLVVSSRSQAAVDKAVKHLREAGSKAAGLACDVSQQEQVLALANFAMQNFGKVDIWFNNAGLETAYGPTMSYSVGGFYPGRTNQYHGGLLRFARRLAALPAPALRQIAQHGGKGL